MDAFFLILLGLGACALFAKILAAAFVLRTLKAAAAMFFFVLFGCLFLARLILAPPAALDWSGPLFVLAVTAGFALLLLLKRLRIL